LVTDGDRMLGAVNLDDILRFLDLKLEVEAGGNGKSSASKTRDEDIRQED
jgi:hypothetical protein